MIQYICLEPEMMMHRDSHVIEVVDLLYERTYLYNHNTFYVFLHEKLSLLNMTIETYKLAQSKDRISPIR